MRLAVLTAVPSRRTSSAGNQLLALLPGPTRARLEPHLDVVLLKRNDRLFRAHEPIAFVYFPVTAIVSFVLHLESGAALEVGLVGRDGVAGMTASPRITTLPYEATVRIPGTAFRIRAEIVQQELQSNAAFLAVIARAAHVLLFRSMQASACNMFHPIEQRCIRWLLTVSDASATPEIPLTHELMATMLGVRRPTVTLVLRSLHQAGLIIEARGRITIRDRAGMLAACCECYRVIRDEQRRVLEMAPPAARRRTPA